MAEAPSIGSEFELPFAAVLEALEAPERELEGRSVASGRTGIALVLAAARAAGRRGPVLLPSYLCESVVQPVLEAGLEPRFFRVRDDLTIDPDDLRRAVAESRPSLLLFVDYFGFPPGEDELAAVDAVRRGVWVIEDCVQGSLLESDDPPVGSVGDFVLTSFRKYLPVPDGGLVRARVDAPLPVLEARGSADADLRLFAKTLRWEVVHRGEPPLRLDRALFERADALLDAQVPWSAASELTLRLLSRLDLGAGMRRRRENFALLADAFEQPPLRDVGTPLLPRPPAGVSPLVFPIRVAGGLRDPLRARLRERGVYPPVHWPLPAAVDAGAFPDAARLSEEILGLPIDQRYDARSIARLLEALEASWHVVRAAVGASRLP